MQGIWNMRKKRQASSSAASYQLWTCVIVEMYAFRVY